MTQEQDTRSVPVELLKDLLVAFNCDDSFQFNIAIGEIRNIIDQPKEEEVAPICEVVESDCGNYPVLEWQKDYKAKIGDKFYLQPQPAKKEEER